MNRMIQPVLFFFLLSTTVAFAQPSNDSCHMAATSIALDCDVSSTTVIGTTIAGTADNLSIIGCVDPTDVGVWYSFVADGPDISIEAVGANNPVISVLDLDPDCNGTVNVIDCGTSPVIVDNALVSGETYHILISFPGGATNAFELCINHPSELVNVDPCFATDITLTGSYTGSTLGTNTRLDDLCGQLPSPFVNGQFFQYDAPDDVWKIDVRLTSPDITSNTAVGVLFGDPGCNMLVIYEDDCNVTLPFTMNEVCIDPTTPVLIFVATSPDVNGDFTLQVTDVSSTNCNDNEVCDVSQDLGVIPSDCQEVEFVECNADACPDGIIYGACDLSTGPTVWYEFTTDAMANLVDIVIDNSTQTDLTMVLTDDCDLALGSWICEQMTGGIIELLQLTVDPNTTYYLAITDPNSTGAEYVINLTVYPDLPYDDICSGYQINAGLNALNNHCTTAEPPGSINTACPAPLTEATAWYEVVVPPGTDYLNVTVTNNLGDPLPSNALIQIGSRVPSEPCQLASYQPLVEQCVALSTPFEFEDYCFDFQDSVIYYILVGTQSDETGSYDISVSFNQSPCTMNDSCTQLSGLSALNPMTPPDDVTPPQEVCLNGCVEYTCPENFLVGPCDWSTYNAVWYEIQTDANAALMNITVNGTGNPNWNPIISMFTGDCDNLTPVALNGNPDFCVQSPDPTLNVPQIPVQSNTTYYLLVGSELDQGTTFDLCISTEILLSACIADHNLEVVDRENNLPLTAPFCPGELITFSYDVDYTVDPVGTGNNCQWLQGVVPVFGEGWDIDGFVPTPNIAPSWDWYGDGEVDYNWPNFRLSTYVENGRTKIAHYTLYPDNYDASNTFMTGTLLPGGWYAVTQGGQAGCLPNPTDPDFAYGATAGCGTTYSLAFNFSIRVREDCQVDDNLEIAVYEFADGSIGCWIEQRCALDGPVVYDEGIVECLPVDVRDSTYEICSEDLTNIVIDPGNPAAVVTYFAENNPNITGASDGSGTNIVHQLENTSDCNEEIQRYIVVAMASPTARCGS